jgi:phosphate transport system substrate-binding protein
VGKDDSASLTGAGATFPQPIYQAWFDDYHSKVASGVQVNYQGVGSGAGVQQYTAKTVDFGASDVGMKDDQIQAAGGASQVQLLPTVIGAVVLSYNISGVSQTLKLDGPTVANIYLGNIKKWDDPAIKALNPDVNLPDNDIVVVYRSDSSGTSGVFTDYLSKVSDDWKTKVGSSTSPNWPTGQGGQGNPGVTNIVANTPNAIGYVELTYALQNKISFADLKNKAGKFIKASIETASAAAAGVTLPEDYRASITNADGDNTYPIATFTYLLLYKQSGKCSAQQPLVDLLWWAYHSSDAQQTIKDLNYSPLPSSLLPRIEASIQGLKCDDGASQSLKTG